MRARNGCGSPVSTAEVPLFRREYSAAIPSCAKKKQSSVSPTVSVAMGCVVASCRRIPPRSRFERKDGAGAALQGHAPSRGTFERGPTGRDRSPAGPAWSLVSVVLVVVEEKEPRVSTARAAQAHSDVPRGDRRRSFRQRGSRPHSSAAKSWQNRCSRLR